MEWVHDRSRTSFGGAFLANALPHFVSGVMGRAFQSPFAKPPGEGLSSSTVNVLWGFLNGAIGLGVCSAGWAALTLRAADHVVVAAEPGHVVRMGLMLARHVRAVPRWQPVPGTRERSGQRHFPFADGLQLPALGRRRAGVQRGHVDAAHRPGLARAHRN